MAKIPTENQLKSLAKNLGVNIRVVNTVDEIGEVAEGELVAVLGE